MEIGEAQEQFLREDYRKPRQKRKPHPSKINKNRASAWLSGSWLSGLYVWLSDQRQIRFMYLIILFRNASFHPCVCW